ncbi:hypothetical protein CI102_8520 [Trichoderma harzianum]|uniref:Uncharacterized protein n=1 Tax=Trichoderma harzianum CBS 226.95 TaxID=983964 RepID=A0A2T4AJ51_TRIHA|nr:hypothetical protein M431DRAFT_389910 [Trichoderma harzianum CBS 226.95]PKK49087.1 hypothetical protein CI102_8520 [Trichoderma harzianum]PTB56948.1 hypothetical protein M431DRAFT_389910 [Trichoderma harzianum CBS 226.95]
MQEQLVNTLAVTTGPIGTGISWSTGVAVLLLHLQGRHRLEQITGVWTRRPTPASAPYMTRRRTQRLWRARLRELTSTVELRRPPR